MPKGIKTSIEEKREEAKIKAIDSLSRYKFQMFGYWAAIWVYLNRLSKAREPNPFCDFVNLAKSIKGDQKWR